MAAVAFGAEPWALPVVAGHACSDQEVLVWAVGAADAEGRAAPCYASLTAYLGYGSEVLRQTFVESLPERHRRQIGGRIGEFL